MNNIKNIIFGLLVLAPTQSLTAASYLPEPLQRFFRRNEVCVSPTLTFPAKVMVHNVRSSSRTKGGELIINASYTKADPQTITTPAELQALVKKLTRSPEGKMFAIKNHSPVKTPPAAIVQQLTDGEKTSPRALSAAALAEFTRQHSPAATTAEQMEDDHASNHSGSDVTLTDLDKTLSESEGLNETRTQGAVTPMNTPFTE